jgi:hypothetical protein
MKSDINVYITDANNRQNLHFYKCVQLDQILQTGTILFVPNLKIKLVLKEISVGLSQKLVIYNFYNETIKPDGSIVKLNLEEIVDLMKNEQFHKMI